MARTSDSDPIVVDFVDERLLPGGQLGLTFAPGKVQATPVSGEAWARDVRIDLRRIRSHYGAEIIVGLIEDHEFEELEILHLPETAETMGLQYIQFPVRDSSTPTDVGGFHELVDRIFDDLHDQRTVVVHCKGGLGRTGTLAACILVRAGTDADEAIRAVRATRPHAIENESQEAFIRSFEANL